MLQGRTPREQQHVDARPCFCAFLSASAAAQCRGGVRTRHAAQGRSRAGWDGTLRRLIEAVDPEKVARRPYSFACGLHPRRRRSSQELIDSSQQRQSACGRSGTPTSTSRPARTVNWAVLPPAPSRVQRQRRLQALRQCGQNALHHVRSKAGRCATPRWRSRSSHLRSTAPV